MKNHNRSILIGKILLEYCSYVCLSTKAKKCRKISKSSQFPERARLTPRSALNKGKQLLQIVDFSILTAKCQKIHLLNQVTDKSKQKPMAAAAYVLVSFLFFDWNGTLQQRSDLDRVERLRQRTVALWNAFPEKFGIFIVSAYSHLY